MNIKDFLTKLQNLPETQKKAILWTIVIIMLAVMGFFWIRSASDKLSKIGDSMKNVQLPQVEMPDIQPNDLTGEKVEDQTTDWKTYTNDKYNFEIKYPSDWAFRQFEFGAAFFSENKPSENTTGNGSVSIAFAKRGASYCKISFNDYIKIAGPSEIQNYESSNTIEKGINSNGVEFYEITWNYADFQGNKKISLPITYFNPEDEQLCGSFEAYLNDSNYADIYSGMISTFKFIK